MRDSRVLRVRSPRLGCPAGGRKNSRLASDVQDGRLGVVAAHGAVAQYQVIDKFSLCSQVLLVPFRFSAVSVFSFFWRSLALLGFAFDSGVRLGRVNVCFLFERGLELYSVLVLLTLPLFCSLSNFLLMFGFWTSQVIR